MTVGQLLTKNIFHSNTGIFGAKKQGCIKAQYSWQEVRSCVTSTGHHNIMTQVVPLKCQIPRLKVVSTLWKHTSVSIAGRDKSTASSFSFRETPTDGGSILFENANVPIVGAAPRTIKRKPTTHKKGSITNILNCWSLKGKPKPVNKDDDLSMVKPKNGNTNSTSSCGISQNSWVRWLKIWP